MEQYCNRTEQQIEWLVIAISDGHLVTYNIRSIICTIQRYEVLNVELDKLIYCVSESVYMSCPPRVLACTWLHTSLSCSQAS